MNVASTMSVGNIIVMNQIRGVLAAKIYLLQRFCFHLFYIIL